MVPRNSSSEAIGDQHDHHDGDDAGREEQRVPGLRRNLIDELEQGRGPLGEEGEEAEEELHRASQVGEPPLHRRHGPQAPYQRRRRACRLDGADRRARSFTRRRVFFAGGRGLCEARLA
jgi:hypothetical protein